MQSLVELAFLLASIGYTAASVLFFADLASRRGLDRLSGVAPWILGGAAIFHLTHVVAASIAARTCAVSTMHSALSLAALILVVAYLVVRRRSRLQALGAFASPLALALLVAAEFIAVRTVATENHGLLAVHVTANLAGLGLFMLAGAVAVLYVVHERRLKTKKLGWMASKLPPLDVLERVQHQLLLGVFPLLSVGIVTGAVFAAQMQWTNVAAIARAVLASASWAIVAGVLVLRAVAGWRGRRAAYGVIVGALLILLVVLGYLVHPALGDGL